jgi:hypothetical protein
VAGINLILNEFRKSCTKDYLDQIDKSDLTAFVVAQKKDGQDDRTVANRLAGVVTFLRAHGVVTVTLRHKYTEKKVKAYRPFKCLRAGNLHLPPVIRLRPYNRHPPVSGTIGKHMLNHRNDFATDHGITGVIHLHRHYCRWLGLSCANASASHTLQNRRGEAQDTHI